MTAPASDTSDFAFTWASSWLTSVATFVLVAGSFATLDLQSFPTRRSSDLSKTVSETAVSGWTLTGVDCSGTGTESRSGQDESFTVVAGDAIKIGRAHT